MAQAGNKSYYFPNPRTDGLANIVHLFFFVDLLITLPYDIFLFMRFTSFYFGQGTHDFAKTRSLLGASGGIHGCAKKKTAKRPL
jgi:hypothetical protein